MSKALNVGAEIANDLIVSADLDVRPFRLTGDSGAVFATLREAFCRFGPPAGHVTIDLTVSANSPSIS